MQLMVSCTSRCGQEEGQHVDSLAIRVWAAGYASTAHSSQMDIATQRHNRFSTFEFTTRFCLIQTETGLNSNVEKRARVEQTA